MSCLMRLLNSPSHTLYYGFRRDTVYPSTKKIEKRCCSGQQTVRLSRTVLLLEPENQFANVEPTCADGLEDGLAHIVLRDVLEIGED